MKVWFVVFLFFFVSALLVVSNYNLHMLNGKEAYQFLRIYYSWFVGLVGDSVRLTAHVAQVDWLPSNFSHFQPKVNESIS